MSRTERRPLPDRANLRIELDEGRLALWTRALGSPASVYGERVAVRGGSPWRVWDPSRSKLAAALTKRYSGPIPGPGESWLYLGAASGTTASHVADLVGPRGFVLAVERSLRPSVRLVALARRYPNLFPIIADAREPAEYSPLMPMVDGVYVDVAQPDQVAIATENARWFLRESGTLLFALKAASLGRERSPRDLQREAVASLQRELDVIESVTLEPFHRHHLFVAAQPRITVDDPTGDGEFIRRGRRGRPPRSRRPRPRVGAPDPRFDPGTERWAPRSGPP